MSHRPHVLSEGSASAMTAEPTKNPPAKPKKSRAGRNLPASIAVGVSLGALALAMLLAPPVFFLVFIMVVAVMAEVEMATAVSRIKVKLCLPPLVVGSIGMLLCAYLLGPEGVWAALLATLIACAIWRLSSGPSKHATRDLLVTSFVAIYLPFLASFVVIMLHNPHHPAPIIVWIVITICNDIGGYAAGVLKGKHPMAPAVSPAKSWEGFAGSVVMCTVAAAIAVWVTGTPLWAIGVLGILTPIIATCGDLGESLIKRDLQLKDMGNLLPGHGGVMDRLDSLLITVPLFFLVSLWIF
ncbi:phosphatidate cytidylyltransferase [Varibaculum cambriense]|uniref:phosphatidate cytidylyltransferase n=1 Tax=Varibaculum cambriense TaxID=184870 RepID=UPI00242D9B0B|nr:phosphatidate cytidylyltransferase [Varibaculum cambriense]